MGGIRGRCPCSLRLLLLTLCLLVAHASGRSQYRSFPKHRHLRRASTQRSRSLKERPARPGASAEAEVAVRPVPSVKVETAVAQEAKGVQKDASTPDVPLGHGFWSVNGTEFVDDQGRVVKFSGVTWSGLEKPEAAPGGLDIRHYDDYFDQIWSLGFNMIRLPFAGETLNSTTFPSYGKVDASPELQGMNSLQVMDTFIAACTARDIKVILDYHRMHLTYTPEIGTWWDEKTPESVWLDNWAMLANRYKGNPTVIGVDLFNEPHPNDASDNFPGEFPAGAPFWQLDAGPYEAYNFRRACLKAIEVIQSIEPNWIIFIEGMWHGPYWWGGNVAKLLETPITEPAGKIAYSAHDYGPFVAPLPWFYSEDFPANLEGMYRQYWGGVIENGTAPVWIGEFGSIFKPNSYIADRDFRDRLVLEHQVKYINQLKASWTIAFWGPDANDTGGMLLDDWRTVHPEKMELLQPIMYPNFTPKIT